MGYCNFNHVPHLHILGITLLITPALILPVNLVDSADGIAGEIYCRVLFSQFMIFLFGIVSVYTVMFLSIERWFAVRHPFKYRTVISSLKVKACVFIIWVLGLLTNAPHLTEMSPSKDVNAQTPCQWSYKDYQTRKIVAFVEISFKFIAPSLVLVLVLCSLYRKWHDQNVRCSLRPNYERQLLNTCAATSFVVLICWSPNQVYYLLYKFDVVTIGTKWHSVTVIFALSTSVINPIIYYVASTTYRRCLQVFLGKVFNKCKAKTRTYPVAEMACIGIERDVQVFENALFTWREQHAEYRS